MVVLEKLKLVAPPRVEVSSAKAALLTLPAHLILMEPSANLIVRRRASLCVAMSRRAQSCVGVRRRAPNPLRGI